jgi:hypothetical protein
MPKLKARKLDAAIEQQAIASAQWLIELKGGLTHKYSQDYWRFSTKAELCGQVETDERFVQGIKDDFVKKHGEVSIHFLPGPGKWNEKLAAKLIADAKQGDAVADQVLREVAATYLERGEVPPKPLADYAATCDRLAGISPALRSEHKRVEGRQMSYLTEAANRRPMLRITAEVVVVFCCAAPLVLELTYGVQALIH